MVDGVIKRARQSGQVANIIAKVVYSQDEFEEAINDAIFDEFEHLEDGSAPSGQLLGKILLTDTSTYFTIWLVKLGRGQVKQLIALISNS
ncbi:MAG: recombinase RecT [Candidatus Arsenophonus phytopathogenicus]